VRIESQHKALLAAKTALAKHAEGVVVMDLRSLSTVAECFVVATATSHRQVVAMTEQIGEELREHGERVWHVEGLGPPKTPRRGRSVAPEPQADAGLSWVLMDCGDVVIHLFNPAGRNFYQLERLWADAPRLPLGASSSDDLESKDAPRVSLDPKTLQTRG